MFWYSLEAPSRGTSNEYHNIFFLRNKKEKKTILFGWKKKKHLIWSYVKSTFNVKTAPLIIEDYF